VRPLRRDAGERPQARAEEKGPHRGVPSPLPEGLLPRRIRKGARPMSLYLDHAATSLPKDPRVVDAVARALVDPGVAPDRGNSPRGRTARRILEEARRL